jgi:hypothetical protein
MPIAAISRPLRLDLLRACRQVSRGTLPDLFRVMLYPAGLREELLEFLLGEPKDIKGFVKNDGPARGGALDRY